jgi:hypothetical protein
MSDRCNSTPDLLDKIKRLLTPHSGRFNSNRLEIDTGNYVAVFLYFFFNSAADAADPDCLKANIRPICLKALSKLQ